jgi:hypothetical protein
MKALLDVLGASAGSTLVRPSRIQIIPAMVREAEVETLEGFPTSPRVGDLEDRLEQSASPKDSGGACGDEL